MKQKLLSILLVVCSFNVNATVYTYSGTYDNNTQNSVNGNFSVAANWSSDKGSAVPGINDTAILNLIMNNLDGIKKTLYYSADFSVKRMVINISGTLTGNDNINIINYNPAGLVLGRDFNCSDSLIVNHQVNGSANSTGLFEWNLKNVTKILNSKIGSFTLNSNGTVARFVLSQTGTGNVYRNVLSISGDVFLNLINGKSGAGPVFRPTNSAQMRIGGNWSTNATPSTGVTISPESDGIFIVSGSMDFSGVSAIEKSYLSTSGSQGIKLYGPVNLGTKGTLNSTIAQASYLTFNNDAVIGETIKFESGLGAGPRFEFDSSITRNIVVNNALQLTSLFVGSSSFSPVINMSGGQFLTVDGTFGGINGVLNNRIQGPMKPLTLNANSILYQPSVSNFYISGYIARKSPAGTLTYPVGDLEATSGTKYHPFKITIGVATPGKITIAYDAHAGTPNSSQLQSGVEKIDTKAFWPVISENFLYATAGFVTRNLTGIFTGNKEKVYMVGYSIAKGIWEKVGPAIPIINGEMTLTSDPDIDMYDYSAFTAGSTNADFLPVKFKNFHIITGNQCNAILNWSSATEQNSKSYEIELSNDANNFATVASIASKNLENGAAYSYIYSSLMPNTNYFRIKAIDFDGQTTFSEVVSVRNTCFNPMITIAPNPVKNNLYISGLGAKTQIIITNLTGQVVHKQTATSYKVNVNVNHLARGCYQIQLETERGGVRTFKFVKE